MKLLAIPNLASAASFEVEPWSYRVKIPNAVADNKAAFIGWCQKPSTQNCHFSGMEGLDPFRRIGKDNPVALIRGLVADYDARMTDAMFQDLKNHCPTEFVPNWCSYTFSGRGRLVWMFDEPVAVANHRLLKSFLRIVSKRLQLNVLLPGFEEEAFLTPSKYYDKGHTWKQLETKRIPRNFLFQWMYEAGGKVNWKIQDVVIPLEIVKAKIDEAYPGEWKGPFEVGSRGRRFWDPDAKNETSVIVRETGFQCFSGDQGFVPWSQVLGTSFVNEYEADKTGEIIADLYYDGKNYWRKPDDVWEPLSKEDLRLMLKVKYGLCGSTSRKETASEVERVMYAIQEQKTVTAALPFVHFPSGLVRQTGLKYLNTSSVKCLEPAKDAPADWGDKFPWLASLIDGLFDPAEQKEFFLSWWKHFYGNALKFKPRTGHALFIAGDPGVGKTLLSTGVVSRSVGGHVDASSYLLGEEKFTSHVVSSPVMSVDDTVPASDSRRHTRYSAMIKKITANRYQTYEEKFQKAGQVLWMGRVIVSCNLDPESVKLLPNVELSLLDKVMLFRCKDSGLTFPSAEEIDKTISAELPYLCRYLLDWEIPKQCEGDARFGCKAYHERSLFSAALQTGASFTFLELLYDFLQSYSEGVVGSKQDAWKGSPTRLLADMSLDPNIGGIASKYKPAQIASLLGQLQSHGYGLTKTESSTQRTWTIPFDLVNNIN